MAKGRSVKGQGLQDKEGKEGILALFIKEVAAVDYEFVAVHPGASQLPSTCAYGRHLHGGIAYQDKIYWGYGNWHKMSCEIPVDIDAFDPVTNSFTHEFDAQTESVYDYRILSNGNLYIPHIDVHSGIKGVFTGKDYSRKVNGAWSDAQAGAWHVFDIQEMNGNIYLIGSIDRPGVGVVFESRDGENSFQQIFTQAHADATKTTRFYFGFVWDNELYVQAEKSTSSRIFDGTAWRNGPNLLPKGGQGHFTNHFEGRVVYVSKDRGKPGHLYAFDGTTTKSLRTKVVKYAVYDHALYVIHSNGTLVKTVNYVNWQTLPKFTAGVATSLVGFNHRLYIGTADAKIHRSVFEIGNLVDKS